MDSNPYWVLLFPLQVIFDTDDVGCEGMDKSFGRLASMETPRSRRRRRARMVRTTKSGYDFNMPFV